MLHQIIKSTPKACAASSLLLLLPAFIACSGTEALEEESGDIPTALEASEEAEPPAEVDEGDSVRSVGAKDFGELLPAEAVDEGADEASSELGSLNQALVTAFDVGVLPTQRSCPNGSNPIRIRFDDEDDDNTNNRFGYIASIISDSNTDFLFCRVDGRALRPLVTASDQRSAHYAVLKLAGSCPNGSSTFTRRFDNEDDDNTNSTTGTIGSISPNVVTTNASLSFCLFRGGATTMTNFPSDFPGLSHFGYGVFADSTFIRSLTSGFVRTDDEDDDNANGYDADASILSDAQQIISGGTNTTLETTEVVR